MGKSAELQEKEHQERTDAVKAEYAESQARRLSDEGKAEHGGERQVANVNHEEREARNAPPKKAAAKKATKKAAKK